MEKLSLEDIHHRMFIMLKDFSDFCKRNNLRYFLAYGTLLGARRHNGFIPWDDDVDVVMPRSDFEKLKKYECINDYIDIVHSENCLNYYHPYQHINLCDKKTIMIEGLVEKQTGKGCYIDVFALDGLPDGKVQTRLHLKRIILLQYLFHLGVSNQYKNGLKGLLSNIIKKIGVQKISKKIDIVSKKIKYCEANNVFCSGAVFKNVGRNIFPKEFFSEGAIGVFEKTEFCIPKKTDEILKIIYGDYMILPPESERIGHHVLTIFMKEEK